jgi:K+-sensing histidine kinase KdpD
VSLLKIPVGREMDEAAMPVEHCSDPAQPEAEPSLARRMSLLGRLAGPLSHEMRNPLNAIFLHLDIVEEEVHHTALEDRTQIDQSLAVVRGEVVRLYDLMQDYLTLARLSNVTCQPEDVRMLLETVAHEVRASLTARGILLRLEGLEGLGEVTVHRPSLLRALINIAQHVAGSVAQGGCLTLRGSRTASHLQVVIQEADTHVRAQAGWQPFSEAPPGASEALHLKLSAVQEIVSAHGGTCEVHDASARTYRVTLPLAGGSKLSRPC